LLAHSEKPPVDAEWDEYLKFLVESKHPSARLLVLTQGGGPSAAQRGRLRTVLEHYPKKKLPTAILTGSVVARGIVTAISWFDQSIEAFPPQQLGAAIKYLGLPAAAEIEIARALEVLKKKLND
jgi:hypothetical protein